MPISSARRQVKREKSSDANQRTKGKRPVSSNNQDRRSMSSFQASSHDGKSQVDSTSADGQKRIAAKYKSIRHISSPSSAAATSAASIVDLLGSKTVPTCHHSVDKDISTGTVPDMQPASISIGGQMVMTSGLACSSKQPNSIGSIMNSSKEFSTRGIDIGNTKNNYLVPNSQYQSAQKSNHQQSQSRLSMNPSTTTNSTAHLNSLSDLTGASSNQNLSHPLSIRRNLNLKYVKTLIIGLMSIDLLITVFVHQFSTQDQISIWLTSYKMRFSLLNLILSAIWFITLIGAILFDLLFILIIGCIVDILSFVSLFVLSVIHFTHRIDYNTVNITSLLGLLFGITMLHVYMAVMTTLTIYLMLAVKRRRSSSSS